MYWCNTSIKLEESCSVIIITFILVFSHIILSSTETILMVEIIDNTSTLTVNQSLDRLKRQFINEPSYDADRKVLSTQNEIASFLHVDDEELSKQLMNAEITIDGSGDTTEPTFETTTYTTSKTITNEWTSISSSTPTQTISFSTTTSPSDDNIVLSGFSRFIIKMSCTNTSSTIHAIVTKFNETFKYQSNITHDPDELPCFKSLDYDVTFNFTTDSNVTVLTELFITLSNITSSMGFELYSVDKCGNGKTVLVETVTSCYLIELCDLCGTNPPRGICLPKNNIARCQCFVNEYDSSMPYVGEFCKSEKQELSTPASWTPIIVGVLVGVASLFCVITCFLLVTTFWRRRDRDRKRIHNQRIQRTWHLPRVQLPTIVTAENLQNYSNQTNPDYDRSETTDSRFEEEFEQNISGNLRTTITRPTTSAVLTIDTISTVSSYDSIDELDAIIGNEDLATRFYDSLDEFVEDNGMLEVVNPHLVLPRGNVDSRYNRHFS